MNTVLSLQPSNPRKQLMFLGEPIGLQRFDHPRYPIFNELTDRQQSYFWRHKDISLTKDRGDHARLTTSERAIFDDNLRFQIAGDSMLSRSINALISHCTNSSLESCMQWWASFETLHSRSYTHILDNAYADPSGFYDSVLDSPAIVNRMTNLKSKFDTLLTTNSTDLRQNLFNAVLAAQIMEGVTFYVSFACSFYFAARGQMTGNGGIIKLISRDENLHVAITQNIMRFWRDVPEEGFADLYRQNTDLIYEAYRMAVQEEKDWANHLFSQGSIVGLTPAGLGSYSEWLGNTRLRSLRLREIFPTQVNPFDGWIKPFFDSQSVQPALQEEDGTSYAKQTGAAASDEDWGDIKL